MATIKGFVTFVGPSKRDGRIGAFVKGVDGWIEPGEGVNLEALKKGDTVTIEGAKLTSGGFRAKQVTVTEKAGAGGGKGGWKGKGGGGYKSTPERDQSIVMQHAQKVAATLAIDMVKAEIVKLPAQAKREEALLLLIDRLTDHLFKRAYIAPGKTPQAAGSDEVSDEVAEGNGAGAPATQAEAAVKAPDSDEVPEGEFADDFDNT